MVQSLARYSSRSTSTTRQRSSVARPATFIGRLRASWRGVGLRLLGVVLGAVSAVGGLVAMQLPLLHPAAAVAVDVGSLPLHATVQHPLWPAQGEAAIVIPQLGVDQSTSSALLPIASLTKMMTAYVVLAKLPLQPGQSGPCLVVNAADVSAYQSMRSSDQSSVAVAAGERLCEADLLRGLLVHSASNFAAMLADLTWGSQDAFIAQMNAVAVALQMVGTHYSDVSGYRPTNVSTASDQGRLAALLMANPVFASDVNNASVVLPVAGRVNSFTPFVGSYGVIGVKSGRTQAAGGCDVMATMLSYAARPTLVITVVLNQRGGDLLGPAGAAALALTQSITPDAIVAIVHRGSVVGRVQWAGKETDLVVRRGLQLSPTWVPLGTSPASYSYHVALHRFSKRLRREALVGSLTVRSGDVAHTRMIVVRDAIGPATLWQDLR